MSTPVPGMGEPGEVKTTPLTRLVLLLFLENTQRWWAAGAMTIRLACSRDAARRVHLRLVAAHWASETWEPSTGKGRRLVRLSPAGAERARQVLRTDLTPGDLVLAAEAGLSVQALRAEGGGEGGGSR
jgi:hypothetical protein